MKRKVAPSPKSVTIRGVTFVEDSPGPPRPAPPLVPDDLLTHEHGFPAPPERDAIHPVTRPGKDGPVLIGLRIDTAAAARNFVRSHLIRYLGRGGGDGRHVFARPTFVDVYDETGDLIGVEIDDWLGIETERVRERIEDFLHGVEIGFGLAGALLASQPSRIDQVASEIPKLPWGTSGNIDDESDHFSLWMRRSLRTYEPGQMMSGVSSSSHLLTSEIAEW